MDRLNSPAASIVLMLMAWAWGGFWTYQLNGGPGELDVDSWAIKITNCYPDRLPIVELFRDPSLWKGPIIPTLYHASYVIYPSVYSPMVLNVLAFGLAALILHRVCVFSNVHPLASYGGLLIWVLYPAYRYIFGMYFAEPIIACLSAGLLWLVVCRPRYAWMAGVLAGILLLGRPPFLPVVAALPVIWFLKGQRKQAIVYSLTFAMTFLPWGIRNYFVTGTFVPFTVEGGQTLFHGSYLPLDEIRWQEFKEDPEVYKLVKASPKDPVERMKYLTGLAKGQVLADPVGQFFRSIRKAERFWMLVEKDEYVPQSKTGIPAMIMLSLFAVGLYRNRLNRLTLFFAVWVFGLWLMHAAVFGILRYSFPVYPLAAVIAVSAIFPMKSDSVSR